MKPARFIPQCMQYCRMAYYEPTLDNPFFSDTSIFLTHNILRDMGFAYYAKFPDTQVLAFRGTDTESGGALRKWTRNFDLLPVNDNGYHDGFYRTWKKFEDWTCSLIENGAISRRKNLLITGHSLGGSLASISALSLYEKYQMNKISLVSFSSPAPFNHRRRDQIRSSKMHITMVRIKRDIVTQICPLKHAGEFISLPYVNIWDFLPWRIVQRHIPGNVMKACLKRWPD